MIRAQLNDVKILINEYVDDLTSDFNIGGEIETSHYLRCIWVWQLSLKCPVTT